MKYIDNYLNRITMYRVVLYGLTGLVFLSILLSMIGLVSYSSFSILVSLILLCFVCYISNLALSRIFDAQLNLESAWITAYILCLVLNPIRNLDDVYAYIVIGAISMLSKYILAINKKHIFNPVAISLVVAGLFGNGLGIWWIGNDVMLFPVLLLGFLILRKTRRFEMFTAFFISSLISIGLVTLSHGFDVVESIKLALLSGPLIFFGTIMLTEPLTTPPNRFLQVIYALIVGSIYGLDFHFGNLYNTPELALVIGNIFAYIVSPKDRLKLTLIDKKNLSTDVYEFIFSANKKINFKPGQYLEWTLGHSKPDSRGNRRYFTLSSSPTEEFIKLGIKTYENPSSFKSKMLSLNINDVIFASQLAGEFTLPRDLDKKMVWIAGGIGVTPFRSMAKYIIDKKEKRDTVLFFSNRTPGDIVYKDIFDSAANYGIRTVNVVNTLLPEESHLGYKVGFIDDNLIKSEVPDYKDRYFYISGPHGMVTAFEATLKKMGVPRSNIKIDFFPGFA